VSTPPYGFESIRDRLTAERLGSFLTACNGDLAQALALYDWNISMAGAIYEQIGRLEVVFRNALDESLVALASARSWTAEWYRQPQLFPGGTGARALADIRKARDRSMRHASAEKRGKVIAELTFGFWRFLCSKHYLTSMWVPALVSAFPRHPSGPAGDVRSDVEEIMQRVHFLRNRVAHHEPIHHRNLRRDHEDIVRLASWIDPDAAAWIEHTSRWTAVLAARP